jgi:hypothetical protein
MICLACMLFVSATSGEPEDIVVLFDMNRGESLAYFEQTRDYVSGGFLKEFVRKGDTFHLISFGDTPKIELSRRIEGEGDYRTIIGRLLLLYPLAPSSSLENALSYAEAFVGELPAGRNKKVVLFTAQSGTPLLGPGARFNGNTQVYVASIPSSLGMLSAGRKMVKTAPTATEKPPTAVKPLPPPLPDTPLVVQPVAPPPETGLPDVTTLLSEPPITLLPVFDHEYEPVLFDKLKVMMIILPLSLLFLLCVLVLAVIFTRKKRTDTSISVTNLIESYLYLMKGKPAPERWGRIGGHSARGLLRRASAIKEQMV